jgi:putative flippase GtrA
MNARSARQQVARFVAVGCGAAAMHWSVVVWLVSHWAWRPLVANVLGWLVAFCISFAGHHLLTFRGHGAKPGPTVARLFIVSAGGFAANEFTYALLLDWTGDRYDVLLAAVLLAVAAGTYLLGRHWVFLPRV